MRNSYQYSNLQSQNWTESCEEVQKNIIKSNPNWLSKNDNIQIQLEYYKIIIQTQVHIRLWWFSFIGHAKDTKVYSLQQDWDRRLEMTESEKDK